MRPLEAKIYGPINMKDFFRKSVKALSNALFRGTADLLVLKLCAVLSNDVEIDKNLTLMISGDLTFDLT